MSCAHTNKMCVTTERALECFGSAKEGHLKSFLYLCTICGRGQVRDKKALSGQFSSDKEEKERKALKGLEERKPMGCSGPTRKDSNSTINSGTKPENREKGLCFKKVSSRLHRKNQNFFFC